MDGIDPPVCTTECMAIKKTQPCTVSIPKTIGMDSTIPSLPPRPGTAPNSMPNGTAASITSHSEGSKTSVARLSRISRMKQGHGGLGLRQHALDGVGERSAVHRFDRQLEPL